MSDVARSQQSIHTTPPPLNPMFIPEPEIVYAVEEGHQASPNSADVTSNTNAVRKPHTKREFRGAAVAGGVAGLLVGGPLVAAVAAGGCALAVTTKGQAGKVARAGGEAVASMGDRLKKIDKKHRVVEKTGKKIVKGCNWVSKRAKPRDSVSPTMS